MEKSESITALAKALARAQAEMPAAAMNATNPFLKNRYADLGSVIQTAQPVLAAHGLSVSQLTGGSDGAISVTTLLMHESGEYIADTVSLPVGEERGKSMAQVAGSIVTYLRRYSLASILGMYADEDTDGHQPAKPAPKPANQGTASQETAVAWPADAVMTKETAENMTDGKGRRYGDLTLKDLSGYYTGINKALTSTDKTDEERAELEQKRDAVKLLIEHKRAQAN